MRTLSYVLFAALCSGCGGSTDGDGTGASGGSGGSGAASGGSGGSGAAGGGGSAGQGGGWTTLIEGTWKVPSGTEDYWCVTKTLTEDIYVKAFRALAPSGTHHTLLLYGNGKPDGEFPCGPTLEDSMIFASGVGTDALAFPDGVALKLAKGTQLLLNLHLFNTGGEAIGGVSGTQVQTVAAADVQQEAEMILPGPMNIVIPPNSEHTLTHDCTFPATATIATIWPHMHQYGKHMKVVHQTAGGATTLHDGPYSFAEQKNYPISPVTIAGGDTIHIECTWLNPTPQMIFFGDSTESEMCFVGLYRYPKLSKSCQ